MNAAPTPLPIAVLISGGGTTLRNLIEREREGEFNFKIRLVVSSNQNAGGLEFARDANIPTHIAARGKDQSDSDYSAATFDPCRSAGAELVVMGGFLKHVVIPGDFSGRVINIHPSLIPAFSGKGYYGSHVHQAVLDYGARISGCTVHFVDDEYDHGPIILQRPVPVTDTDTASSLAARVFEQECIALPIVIRLIAAGMVRIDGRRVIISE